MTNDRRAKLALEDGTVFTGRAIGAAGERCGEVVFNTSMTGYQEVLTDPSYKGQIVTMTYPHIGNYGVNGEDEESGRPQVEGFVVRELARHPSNFRSHQSLPDYLTQNGIPGIEGIDTRALVRRIRVRGAMTGVLSTTDLDNGSLVHKAKTFPNIIGRDLVKEVVPEKEFVWEEGQGHPLTKHVLPPRAARHHVVAMDYGMKWNIPPLPGAGRLQSHGRARHRFGRGRDAAQARWDFCFQRPRRPGASWLCH